MRVVLDGAEFAWRLDSGDMLGSSSGYLPDWTPEMQTGDDLSVSTTCAVGIVLRGAGAVGYLNGQMNVPQRLLLVIGAVLLVAPDWTSNFIGLACALPVVAWQYRRGTVEAPGAGAGRPT